MNKTLIVFVAVAFGIFAAVRTTINFVRTHDFINILVGVVVFGCVYGAYRLVLWAAQEGSTYG